MTPLVSDLERLLETGRDADVIIYAEYREELRAHSNILYSRLPYFCRKFDNERDLKRDGKFCWEEPNIPSRLFKMILRFIYCENVDSLLTLDGPDVFRFLIAVETLEIGELSAGVQGYWNNKMEEFLQRNPVGVLEVVYQYKGQQYADLWRNCIDKICDEPEYLFGSDEFIKLESRILESFLKRDDLNMDEIEIWDRLIDWCRANKSQNITKFRRKEMERTIKDFLPLIRFRYISPEDFYDRVYPHKSLIPSHFFERLVEFYLVPNRISNACFNQPYRRPKFNYDSALVGSRHFAIFAGWIKKLNYDSYKVKHIPYDFKLLYRASRDGVTVDAFHNKCDNKGRTIVISKIRDSNQIIGGYNPLSWNSDNAIYSTSDSFIFSFKNRNNLKSNKVGYSIGNECSIQCSKQSGPVFGMIDFSYVNREGYSRSYNIIEDMPTDFFNIDDYEVFQVKDLNE